MTNHDDLDPLRDKVIDYYRQNAASRFDYFEQSLADHCRYCLQFMLPAPGHILDVGSGSGRDAAFFAKQGYQVTAIEPAHELRELAAQKHAHPNIQWIDGRLPDLETLSDQNHIYTHIHLSAVIFHLPENTLPQIFKRTHQLLQNDGTLFIGLRHGPSDPARPMFNIRPEMITQNAESLFSVIDIETSEDDFKRADVVWSRMVLKKIS